MALKHIDEYRDFRLSKQIINKIHQNSKKPIRIMEVCGTHTMSIFKSGIRSVLPDTIKLISGPGCPVCITAQKEIDDYIEIARNENVILTVFGDLMKVPGKNSSLMQERSNGKDIRIVYSTLDAMEIARKNPDKLVVFIGIGFETTTPTIAASIISAKQMGFKNFFIYSSHKLVPPALEVLMNTEGVKIDGFLLPGHVLLISGTDEYEPFVNKYKIPTVVAGFEPVDILNGISKLVIQIENNEGKLENAYERAVRPEGNQKAKKMIYEVFETTSATWRGICDIPESGLAIRNEYKDFDILEKIEITLPESKEPRGCSCGAILTGLLTPPDCKLYKKVCTPVDPIGPCMVSNEGTCAAYYKYHN